MESALSVRPSWTSAYPPASRPRGRFWRGTELWSRAKCLRLDLLGETKCVIDLDAEIAHCRLDLGMAQQELNGPEVPVLR
jgi:hypothetical protein